MGVVDFTGAGARRWFAGKLRALLRLGVDCFKTDFGERIPTDVVYADGSDPVLMHNAYTLLYNRTVYEALADERGQTTLSCSPARPPRARSSSPCTGAETSTATCESMAETLRGGLSLGLCGFGFWSHDIGGFESSATADLYNRWVAFGLLSSHSRLHGAGSYACRGSSARSRSNVLRFFTRLKCRLMPYLYAKAREALPAGRR